MPRILVIDDNDLLRRSIRRTLRGLIDVAEAEGVEAAIALLNSDDGFDAIFCDLQMPGKDAIDFVELLSRLAPHLVERTIIMSGGPTQARYREFSSRSGFRMLEKPMQRDEMTRLTFEIMSRHGRNGRGNPDDDGEKS